jgi:hypothetical protein
MKLTMQEEALFTLYGYYAVHVGQMSITLRRIEARLDGPLLRKGTYMQLLRSEPIESWIRCLKQGFAEQAVPLSAQLWGRAAGKTLTAELLLAELIDKANGEKVMIRVNKHQ